MFEYVESGSYNGLVELQNPKKTKLSFVVPQMSEPETTHIILQVTDNGSPALNSYQRIIITVLP